MTSDKQIIANQLNALLSTGPNSPEGKRMAALNAGTAYINGENVLLPWEDPDEYLTHFEQYFRLYTCVCDAQITQITTYAENMWRMMRGRRHERELILTLDDMEKRDAKVSLNEIYLTRVSRENERLLKEYRTIRDELASGKMVLPEGDNIPKVILVNVNPKAKTNFAQNLPYDEEAGRHAYRKQQDIAKAVEDVNLDEIPDLREQIWRGEISAREAASLPPADPAAVDLFNQIMSEGPYGFPTPLSYTLPLVQSHPLLSQVGTQDLFPLDWLYANRHLRAP
jgi:hypothetical protein